jgi:stage III sporulation protein SpoIIIAA
MMVPSLDRQSAVMIECVQNHTPEVMAIDEIGRPTEVEASDDYLDIYDVQGVDFDSSAYTLLPESFNVTDLPDSCPILVDAKFTLSEENKRPAKVALGFTSTEAKEKFYREMARRMASEIEISGAWLIRATHMTTTAISLALSLVFV